VAGGFELLGGLPGIQMAVSTDQGRHWRNVVLPAVGGIRPTTILWGPWFFPGKSTGLTVARVRGGAVVMTTTNGGGVWTAGHIFPNLPSTVSFFAFSAHRWWLFAQSISTKTSESAQFWSTTDGATRRSPLPLQAFEALLHQGAYAAGSTLDFVTPKIGYMNWMSHFHAVLFRTGDGVLTWQRLPAFSHPPAPPKR
jgi:photosystem II stability/assembly factor-like uncharacterized protein